MATKRYSGAGGFGWAEEELMVEDKPRASLVEAVARPLSVELLNETRKQLARSGGIKGRNSVQLAGAPALELGLSAALRATVNEGLRLAWGALLRKGLKPNALDVGPRWFVPSLLAN